MDTWLIGLAILILGFILLAVEVATPGTTFMAIPGTVAVVLGIIGTAVPDWLFSQFWYAPVISAVVAIPVTAVTVWGYQKLGKGHPPITTVGSSLIGRQGVVTVEVIPDSTKGKVRIGGQSWSATSEDKIPVGARVEVVESEGVHVTVMRVESIAKFESEERKKQKD